MPSVVVRLIEIGKFQSGAILQIVKDARLGHRLCRMIAHDAAFEPHRDIRSFRSKNPLQNTRPRHPILPIPREMNRTDKGIRNAPKTNLNGTNLICHHLMVALCRDFESAHVTIHDLYQFFLHYIRREHLTAKGIKPHLFRNITNGCENPDEIVGSINNTMEERNASNMFCTLFVGVLDLATGHMTYCNAGHNAPMVKRAGKERDVRFAKVNVNLAIGVLSRFAYKGEEMQLHPGDMVLLYTDGVTEAEDRNKNLFGDEAALAAFADATRNTSTDSKKCMESIYDALTAHTSGAEQNDDITMLAIAFKGRGEI